MNQPMQEMPRYKSHKIVHALKIHNIDLDSETGAAVITPADEGYGPFGVDAEYMGKHKPRIGGYYVVYDDGYKSWSPAEAFEKGYTKLDNEHSPLSELKAALQADEDYAWTWFCNLACIGIDCGGAHETANRYAAQFMKNAFEVDVRTHQQWKKLESQWEEQREEALSWNALCDTALTKLQAVIYSEQDRTHEQMKALADRLVKMGTEITDMLSNVKPTMAEWLDRWEAAVEARQSTISREEAEKRYYKTYGRD